MWFFSSSSKSKASHGAHTQQATGGRAHASQREGREKRAGSEARGSGEKGRGGGRPRHWRPRAASNVASGRTTGDLAKRGAARGSQASVT
eukprot:9176572-Heterocapsa_arctica.AAC.1